MKIFIICNLLHVVPSIIAVEIHEKHTREPPIAATRWKMEERLPPCAEFSYVVENLFVRRVRMRREGVRNSRRRLETRERETRAPRRMPRDWLPTDAGRRLWIGAVGGSSRWNGGEGIRRGRERSVDLRGVTGWEMPVGPHGHWEQMGIHPAGIYTGWVVSSFDARGEIWRTRFCNFYGRRWTPYLSENLILIKEGTNVLRMVLTDGEGEEINVCEEIEAIWDKLIRKYS